MNVVELHWPQRRKIYMYLFLLMDVCALSSLIGFIFKKARSRPRSFLTRSIRFRFTTPLKRKHLNFSRRNNRTDTGIFLEEILEEILKRKHLSSLKESTGQVCFPEKK